LRDPDFWSVIIKTSKAQIEKINSLLAIWLRFGKQGASSVRRRYQLKETVSDCLGHLREVLAARRIEVHNSIPEGSVRCLRVTSPSVERT